MLRRLLIVSSLLLFALAVVPHAMAPSADSVLVGKWIGTGTINRGERVVLAVDGTGSIDGEAIKWKAWGSNRFRISIGDKTRRGTYSLTEPRLVVRLEDVDYSYRREGEPPGQRKKVTEPDAESTDRGKKVQGFVVPPPLTGAGKGKTRSYAHPKGFFTCQAPAGWTVAKEMEDALLVNPGLGPKDTLEAIIFLTWGSLDEDERGVKPALLVDRAEPEFRSWMRQHEILLSKPEEKAVPVLVGDVPGATQVWTGKTSSGQAVRLWLGGIVKREYYLTVSVVLLDAKADRFLPGVKQVFASLEATPPEHNRVLEAALAGRSIQKGSSESGGFFGSTYDFDADGSVKKEMLMSGLSGAYDISGSTEEWGTYEVVGDILFMYFKDGQDSGTVVVEDRQVVGVRFGESLYHLR
jgi:hypothetical protein